MLLGITSGDLFNCNLRPSFLVWIPKQVISKYKLHFTLLDIQFED
ncbi:hypothetical protein HanIR_Chr12g0576761 [Helianthus annuus]|nr:hypothetical protein HanIR_Chr12g0576761 [Helianthus annuus]